MKNNPYVKVHSKLSKDTKKKLKELLKKLKKSQDDMIKEVASVIIKSMDDDGAIFLTTSEVAEIRDGIYHNLNDVTKDEKKFIDGILTDAYKQAYKDTASIIGIGVDWNIVRDEFIQTAVNKPINGSDFSSRIWSNTNDLANRIYDDVLDCVRTGKRPNEISRKIKDDYGVTAYQASRLVNTELAKVVNEAQMEVYRNSGVVDKVLYTATLESNTCEHCAELDGKEFTLRDAPEIPKHPNCKCALIPIVDGYHPKMRADNTTKKNIEYKTYKEWQGS